MCVVVKEVDMGDWLGTLVFDCSVKRRVVGGEEVFDTW